MLLTIVNNLNLITVFTKVIYKIYQFQSRLVETIFERVNTRKPESEQ